MATSKKSAPGSETVASKAPAAKRAPAAAKATSKPPAVKSGAAPQSAVNAPAKAASSSRAIPPAKKAMQPKPLVQGPMVDAAQRANYIEVAAYYIAQRRGFMPGDAQQDYLDAAAEIDQLIAAGHFSR